MLIPQHFQESELLWQPEDGRCWQLEPSLVHREVGECGLYVVGCWQHLLLVWHGRSSSLLFLLFDVVSVM